MDSFNMKYSGEALDIAIERSLKISLTDPGIVLLNNKIKLNDFIALGFFSLTDVELDDSTQTLLSGMIPLFIYNYTNIEKKVLIQVAMTHISPYARLYENNKWGEWVPYFINSLYRDKGDSETILIDMHNDLYDNMTIDIQLASDINRLTSIQISGNENRYQLLTSQGTPIGDSIFRKDSIIEVLFNSLNNAFYIVGSPIENNDDTYDPDDLLSKIQKKEPVISDTNISELINTKFVKLRLTDSENLYTILSWYKSMLISNLTKKNSLIYSKTASSLSTSEFTISDIVKLSDIDNYIIKDDLHNKRAFNGLSYEEFMDIMYPIGVASAFNIDTHNPMILFPWMQWEKLNVLDKVLSNTTSLNYYFYVRVS